MKCPKTLRLLGVDIPISFQKSGKGKGEIDEETFGEWDPNDLSIKITSDIPVEHQKIVLLHEMLHGMDELLGLNLSHKAVYALSQSFYAALIENPEVIDWIYEK